MGIRVWTDAVQVGPAMGQAHQTENNEEIDVKALQDMYKRFATECPSGQLFLHEFKRFFGVEPTGEASDYAENMFRAFDTNGVSISCWCFFMYLPSHGTHYITELFSISRTIL